MNKGLLFVILIIIFLSAAVWLFERRRISAKEIAVISVLAGIAALGRVPFAVIPSAQPTTFIVIVSGYVFGCTAGLWVGMIAAVVSNMFLGQGPWTIMQMFSWGVCGLSAGILGKIFPQVAKVSLFWVCLGILFG